MNESCEGEPDGGHGRDGSIVLGRRASCKGAWFRFAVLQCLASGAPARDNQSGRDRIVIVSTRLDPS
jgi:hypothetical protein